MATKTIGQLPVAAALDDATLFEVEQGGLSRRLTGAQLKTFIQANGGGTPGAGVEMRATATYLQWRNVGDTAWINLVALADLTATAVQLTGDQTVNGKKKFPLGILLPALHKHDAPASGDTVQLVTGVEMQAIPMAASLAALTIRLPDWPDSGFTVVASLPKAVTALTVQPSTTASGASSLAGAPTTTTEARALRFRYFIDDNTWYMV